MPLLPLKQNIHLKIKKYKIRGVTRVTLSRFAITKLFGQISTAL
jgi:hypothetical protein